MKKNKLILFGAGKNGRLALEKYGTDKVAFFCDNALQKQGNKIEGITIISFEEMVRLYCKGYIIMVTPKSNAYMRGQLELEGIYDYLIFRDEQIRYPLMEAERISKCYADKNKIVDMLVAKTRKTDILADITDFAEITKEALKEKEEKKFALRYYGVGGGESSFYGNLHALIKYGKVPENDMIYSPEVSHHGCMLLYTPSFQYKSAVIMPGKYYKRKIHERLPYVPVFAIGPYIHYVDGIYDSKKVEEEKKKIGEMLLVFLPHSIEDVERSYNKKMFIDNILEEYGNIFQSIWCCVYWADINNPVCEYAMSRGIHIVSAGFRFDCQFNRRLKTILELADAVVVGDIGTFIAYALYMGKPVGRIDISNKSSIASEELHTDLEKKLLMIDEGPYEQQFYELFDKELKNTDKQKVWMNGISGFDQVKDSEYIRNIFEISKDIWMQCEGDLFCYPDAVRQVYFNYDKQLELTKMTILKDAVGSYID